MIIIHLGGLSTGIYELYFHFCFFWRGGLRLLVVLIVPWSGVSLLGATYLWPVV